VTELSGVALPGPSILLREFRTGDVDDAFRVVGDERVTKFLSFDSRSYKQAAAMISAAVARTSDNPRSEYYLAVATPDKDRLVGFIRLALGGVAAAKLGYAVAADHWGKGYATEAVQIMLKFAFERLELHRVTAAIGPDNDASLAVVRKIGFLAEGRLRDHVFTNGAWRDSLLYSLLSDDFLVATDRAHNR
jgi:RimJ/RimL family protein N-acetyltransferase